MIAAALTNGRDSSARGCEIVGCLSQL